MVNLLALGPIELWSEGRQLPLGSVKERCVLAVLLHARGESVSMETIAACVWDDGEPPQDTVGNIRTYISRLNKRLRRAGDVVRVERCSPGRYLLRAAPGAVDLTCFRDLRARARAAVGRHDTEEAIALLREAEALWRGEPLQEFGGDWAKPLSHRLHEDLLRVKEERISLELALGGHADLVGELHELVARNPFAQRAVGFLMKALYRSGRHADALDVYRNTYRLLGERLGIRPDAELQRLNRQIIDQDPELDREAQPLAGSTARPAAAPGHEAAPGKRAAGTLPRDTAEFTGRTGQLAILLADTGREDSEDSEDSGEAADAGTSLPLTVVYGMAGIGKTATAVRAAYRLRERYPDGQFYVDLRGYSEQSRCEPREALALLLGSCGAATDLPDSLDERAARWREWTARHRALVVLDNARATYQVNPLLPGAPTCRAIVTSRNRLSGLDGATPVFLDVLSLNEGMELFTRIAGAARTRDRVTLSRVVDACGRHPLAIQLLAGRYRHRDSWDLEHLLERLTEAQDPLEEFDEALTAAFQLSYAELDGRSRHLLRLLALHPGPDVSLGGVAALLGSDRAKARQSVEGLLDAFLLNDTARDRFALHDLVRAFGLQICRREEPEESRRSATHRLLTYYLRSADRADRLVNPGRRRLPVGEGAGTGGQRGGEQGRQQNELAVRGEEFGSEDEASVWVEVERANLLAAARTAASQASPLAASFAHVLAPALKLWGVWNIAAETHAAAVAVLRPGGDRHRLAQALVEHADTLAKGAPCDALSLAAEALSLFKESQDVEGRAEALFQTGRAQLAAGRPVACRDSLDRALRLYREAGNRRGEAEALNVRGVALNMSGKRPEAAACFRAMHRMYEQLGEVRGQVRSLNNLGEIHRLTGRYEDARVHYEKSLALVQRIGGRQERANLYNNLGIVCQAAGETAQAMSYFQEALASYRAGHDALGEADTLISLGAMYAAGERHNQALWHYKRAEQIARGIENPDLRQTALVGIGLVQRRLGRFDLARESCTEALDLARKADIPLGVAEALEGLAHVAAVTGGPGRARELAGKAARLYERLGERERASALRQGVRAHGVTGS